MMALSDDPDDVLVAYGLGSCVAICLYDSIAHVGGLLHALLPTQTAHSRRTGNPTKYVDQGIKLLSESFQQLGGWRYRTQAYICGGARILATHNFGDIEDIGQRNVQMARATLKAAKFSIEAEAIGGQEGRTVKFSIATGEIVIKTLKEGESVLNPVTQKTPNLGGIQ
jgi:chemotaxis protein CheD